MYSEPRKIVFTGLVVGAVAIGVGAYVSHSDEEWLPSDELGVTHGGSAGAAGRGNTMSGAVRSAAPDAHGDSAAARANSLKAARNSLLRDDVAAARAQLNAISPAHRDDQQVLALQKEIQAQADREQRALAAAPVDPMPESAQKPARSSPSPAVKSGHSRDTQLASREHSTRAAGYARNRRNEGTVVAKSGVSAGSGANVPAAGAVPVANESTYAPPSVKVVRGPGAPAAINALPLLQASGASSESQSMSPSIQAPQPAQSPQVAPATTEMTAQASVPSPVAQNTVPSAPLLKPDGPKTRAQVRAEIVRARENGSLPAFGNPDPAGPGGAPSLTIAPRP